MRLRRKVALKLIIRILVEAYDIFMMIMNTPIKALRENISAIVNR